MMVHYMMVQYMMVHYMMVHVHDGSLHDGSLHDEKKNVFLTNYCQKYFYAVYIVKIHVSMFQYTV